jgi:hypothetical protein
MRVLGLIRSLLERRRHTIVGALSVRLATETVCVDVEPDTSCLQTRQIGGAEGLGDRVSDVLAGGLMTS